MTFGRKREPLPPFPTHLLESRRAEVSESERRPVDRPKGTVVVPVVPEASDPISRVERWATRAAAPSEPVVEVRPPEPEPEPEPAPAPAVSFPASVAHEDAPTIEFLPPRAVAAPEPEAPVAVPLPPVLPELPVAAEPEPEPDPEPEPEVAEAPEEKVPLLKREISFKRKPKPAKEPKAKKAKEPKAKKVKPPKTEKTPLLKREVSFKRKPEEPTAEAPQAETPKAEKTPLLKRELSFKRTSKPAKANADGEHKVTRVVGLRIGSSQIAAAHVQNNGSHELVQLARGSIDRGLVVEGEVRDAEGLTRALKDFFAANKLPRKDVRLGIASSRIGVRVLDVPPIDDPKQFDNAIRFRAQELLPIPVVDAILDHVVLGDFEDEEGTPVRRVLLVFAHRELVNRFAEVCRGAGIRLAGIDLEAFGLLRAVADPGADGENAVVAVAIGHERTVLAVSDGRICDFTRVLEWGGAAIDRAIARALDLAPSQAEPVKHALDLGATEAPDGITPVQFEAIKAAVRSEIGVLGRELVSSLRFYQSRAESLAIGEVILAGGGAKLGGLADELQRSLGAPVRTADPLARVTLGKKVTAPDDPAAVAIAVGLGIEV